MTKILVEFDVDLPRLNQHLGNTPNVTLRAALNEFLTAALEAEQGYCDRCGSGVYTPIDLNSSFKIVDEGHDA